MPVEYKTDNVLVAARKRIATVFDSFARVVVSVSGGKDSTVLYHLALEEAERRNRPISLFFLDQEAEYASTITMIESMMTHPLVISLWLQIPIRMTNATSYKEEFLYAWEPGAAWMREKHPLSIKALPGAPDRFYDFFAWYEKQVTEETAWLIGLRSKESFNRFRSVTSHAGWNNLTWSTKTKSPLSFRFYPLYDWTFGDVWKCIADHHWPYNRYYDLMFARRGQNMSAMRVSNLIHEKSFRCLADLQETEPETYERLVARLSGVHCAAIYAREPTIYDAAKLPDAFPSWRAYRDYLLASAPSAQVARFAKRFAAQPADEETCRQQVKQMLINDYENSVPVAKSKKELLRARYWDQL